ncbi:HAD superfamily hydrolase (TIGR01509 family) [Catenuloplanes indicus]|uniref:HAD superfamily hydrolase (TIGR01509 family) n=2 Tax=Catenuloplanes indicus TaxID=137267 RepID=A0AAE4B1K2_9ACTN|nr:HAD superfamily hydrolase (TIGR01509 family) [Catenuloplanes indicus]
MEVLRYAAALGRPALTRMVEDALCAAELRAAGGAVPTPFARELIMAAHRTGRRTAIVSNNSAAACTAYLTAHGLERFVHPIVGRAYADPARMKPDPAPVLAAMRELDAEPGECVLIGDSVSDVTAARRAGVAAIAYANKPGKAGRLAAADVVVHGIDRIVAAVEAT